MLTTEQEPIKKKTTTTLLEILLNIITKFNLKK